MANHTGPPGSFLWFFFFFFPFFRSFARVCFLFLQKSDILLGNCENFLDIAEVTFQAYTRQQITNEEPRRCYHLKIRFILMAVVSTVIASLIIYWFVNSILVNHHNSKHSDSNGYRSALRKQSRFELPSQVEPLEYT